MTTLLELQELFRNISDPEVKELLRTSPPETRWMAMDEERRRAEMRKVAKATEAESQIKPRNMLEEYQASASGVLGGQSLGDMGQDDLGQYGEIESSGSPDPYAGQQGGVQEYALGGLVPIGAAAGRAAAASSIPWLAKLAKRLGAKVAPQAPKPALGPAQIPPGWTIGPNGIPMPPRGGVPGPAGRLSPPHPSDPAITTPFGQIPARGVNLPKGPIPGTGRPVTSVPDSPSVPGGAAGAAGEAAKEGWMRRHKLLTGGAALAGAGYMMGDNEGEENPPGVLALGNQVGQNAPSGTSAYMELLKRFTDRDDELRERIGDSRISKKDKIRRIGLAASSAMMTTPGDFGTQLGAAFGAAGQAMGAISAEEDTMLRSAILEHQIGSRSVTDLIGVIAAINKSMQASGRGSLTKMQIMKIVDEVGPEGIPKLMADLQAAEALIYGGGQQAPTDYDHSTLGSAYGTD